MSFWMKRALKNTGVTLIDLEGFLNKNFNFSAALGRPAAEIHTPSIEWSRTHHLWTQQVSLERVFKISADRVCCDNIPDGGDVTFLYQDMFDLDELLERVDYLSKVLPKAGNYGTKLFRIQTSSQLKEYGSQQYDYDLIGADGVLVDYKSMLRESVPRDDKDLGEFNKWFSRQCTNKKFGDLPLGIIGQIRLKHINEINANLHFVTLQELVIPGLKICAAPEIHA